MIMVNKTKVFVGLFIGLALLTTGCTPGNHFTQEPVEGTSIDILAVSEAGSTGAGARSISSPSPAPPPVPPP